MAIKARELRDLSPDELRQKLDDTKEELFNLRFQHATGQLDNYRRLRELRGDLARLNTVIRERELEAIGTESPAGVSDSAPAGGDNT
jgi:large subunit ribosomal protein L29